MEPASDDASPRLPDTSAPARAGLVRPARRPPGWIAPGPRPVTPERPEVWPGEGEDLCYLAGDFRILQRIDGHRWSADDLVTAAYAAACFPGAPPKRAVDLGCGIGTVLLFTTWLFPETRCTGVEAQEVSAGMARRSVAWNGVDGRCDVRLGDLRDPATIEGIGPADLVTGTPPYMPVGTGVESGRVQCAPCRFEHRGGVEAYCAAAARLLAPGAPFVGCAAARQRARVEAAAQSAGLALDAWQDIVPREGKAPLFAAYVLRKARFVTATREDPALVVRGLDGRFTEAFNALRRRMGIPA